MAASEREQNRARRYERTKCEVELARVPDGTLKLQAVRPFDEEKE
jgi:hypothetical protein